MNLKTVVHFSRFDFEHELVGKDWIVTSSDSPEKIFVAGTNFVNDVAELNPSKLGWFRDRSYKTFFAVSEDSAKIS
jgi:hypothetical protein